MSGYEVDFGGALTSYDAASGVLRRMAVVVIWRGVLFFHFFWKSAANIEKESCELFVPCFAKY